MSGSERVGRMIEVEVVYAVAGEQAVVRMAVAAGCTAWEAVERSGLLQKFSAIEPARCKIGVFGRECARAAPLQDGDRVELYRALVADPKTARRQRARR